MDREASIDTMGRVCIPKKYLKDLGWQLSTKDKIAKVNVSMDGDSIVIKQDTTLTCSSCGSALKAGFIFCPKCGKEV